ncbi:hypothetical protein SNEBB_002131 [Seison nebaliae]|nr:hypothetical protein SNEBB_002131 [Seison nebaliae]
MLMKTNVKILLCIGLFILLILLIKTGKKYTRNNTVKLSDLLAASIVGVERSGKIVIGLRRNASKEVKGKTDEGAPELLTIADRLSNANIYEYLNDILLNGLIVSEEKTEENNKFLTNSLYREAICENGGIWWNQARNCRKNLKENILQNLLNEKGNRINLINLPINRLTVWIDPLDATQEYTEKLFNYVTIMIGISLDGVPIIGVIHRPFSNQTYWAYVDEGQEIILKNFNEKPKDKNEPLTVIVSRSHAADIEKILKEKLSNKVDVKVAGGSGYKTLSILGLTDESAHIYLHKTKIKKWDILAPNALLLASGGSMTTLKGEKISYSYTSPSLNKDGVSATFPQFHDLYKKIFP